MHPIAQQNVNSVMKNKISIFLKTDGSTVWICRPAPRVTAAGILVLVVMNHKSETDTHYAETLLPLQCRAPELSMHINITSWLS